MQAIRNFPRGQDAVKVRSRIAKCARDAGTGMKLDAKSLENSLRDFACGFYEALFSQFGDEPWICEADLLLVLDVAFASSSLKLLRLASPMMTCRYSSSVHTWTPSTSSV